MRPTRRTAAALLAALALGMEAARAGDAPPEPDGYRLEDYRSPTPATLRGARVLAVPEAEALWREGRAVFLDVLPRPEKPPNLPPGTVWRDAPRANIPGSAWLANAGYGALSEGMDRYFRRSLEELTGGDRERPLVFYCLADCWMSWNAAKRALALGHREVAWFPEGTDGWARAGLPLAPDAKPRP